MDIAKAIIAALATIISAIVTLLVSEHLKKRRYQKVEPEIIDTIYGKWKGQVQHKLADAIQTHIVELELKVTSAGEISGKASFSHDSEIYLLILSGGFYSTRFIKVNYENSNKAVVQFGTFIFRLTDSAKNLTGNFVGYGHLSGNVISGKAEFEKV